MICKYSFVLSIVITFIHFGNCNYVAVVTGRLPSNRNHLQPVYDGKDSVFLLGGVIYENRMSFIGDSILLYSISSGSLTEIGKFPTPTSWGKAIYDGYGNVFYFGGSTWFNLANAVSTIWRFNITHPTPVVVGHLPFSNIHSAAAYDGGHHVYIFGGYTRETDSSIKSIVQFNIITHKASIVADLPMPLMAISAANRKKAAFVFGGYQGGNCGQTCHPPNVIRYSLLENRANYTKATFPSFLSHTTSVTVNHYIYVMGGYLENGQSNRKLHRFNTKSEELDTFELLNLPDNIRPNSIYVPKTKRIYLFGSMSSIGLSPEIFHIQL